MFYNEGYSGSVSDPNLYSLEGVSESPYGIGLKAGLMHVYENECNWNALVKSVSLAEMTYARENAGASLFVHEAGAIKGFIEKAKAFFKKVIEKIKQIFKSFMAKINSFAVSDKTFLKKYRTDINRKTLGDDLEFTGYEKFKKGYSFTGGFDLPFDKTSAAAIGEQDSKIIGSLKGNASTGYSDTVKDAVNTKDSDALSDLKEKWRGKLLNKGPMDESEFREELKNMLWGDKETFDIDSSIRSAALKTIEDSKQSIKDCEKAQKDAVKAIDNYIKALEKYDKEYSKANKDESAGYVAEAISKATDLWRSQSNDITIAFSMQSQALKDANRQAKAICVKILGYSKKESAAYSESVENEFFNVDFA